MSILSEGGKISGRDNLKTLALVDAAYRGIESGSGAVSVADLMD